MRSHHPSIKHVARRGFELGRPQEMPERGTRLLLCHRLGSFKVTACPGSLRHGCQTQVIVPFRWAETDDTACLYPITIHREGHQSDSSHPLYPRNPDQLELLS